MLDGMAVVRTCLTPTDKSSSTIGLYLRSEAYTRLYNDVAVYSWPIRAASRHI